MDGWMCMCVYIYIYMYIYIYAPPIYVCRFTDSGFPDFRLAAGHRFLDSRFPDLRTSSVQRFQIPDFVNFASTRNSGIWKLGALGRANPASCGLLMWKSGIWKPGACKSMSISRSQSEHHEHQSVSGLVPKTQPRGPLLGVCKSMSQPWPERASRTSSGFGAGAYSKRPGPLLGPCKHVSISRGQSEHHEHQSVSGLVPTASALVRCLGRVNT